MIADPAFGNRELSVAAFEDAWIDSPRMGRVAFIVRRPGASTPSPAIPAPLAPRFE